MNVTDKLKWFDDQTRNLIPGQRLPKIILDEHSIQLKVTPECVNIASTDADPTGTIQLREWRRACRSLIKGEAQEND